MGRAWRFVWVTAASASAIGLVLTLALRWKTTADVPPDWCITEPGEGDEVHTICIPKEWDGG
jgi:hypothetical protein